MLPPTKARGLLGIFPCGTDPPTTNQRDITPPVRSPTSSSLRAILAAGTRGRGAQGGVSGRRSPRDSGGRRRQSIWEERERSSEDKQ